MQANTEAKARKFHHLLDAVASRILVTLPSADHAGPDAEALVWIREGTRAQSTGTAEDAAEILHLQANGLVTAGDSVVITWDGYAVKGAQLVITEAGQRMLTRLTGRIAHGGDAR